MKKLIEFIGKVLNVLEHARVVYRRVRNLDKLEQAERAIMLYKKLFENSSNRHRQLEGWIREAAARRDRITEGSVNDAIEESNKPDSGPTSSR